jgi:hypothetical protein
MLPWNFPRGFVTLVKTDYDVLKGQLCIKVLDQFKASLPPPKKVLH